jgi:hypothetical protein
MTVLITLVIGGQLLTFDNRADCQRYRTDWQIAATCVAVPIRLNDDELE